jgi:hypothetical protein
MAPDARQFVLNIAACFAGGRPGNFLAYSDNFSLTSAGMANAMAAGGHTWLVSRSIDFSLPNLRQYDGIFVAGNTVNQQVLLEYLAAGGHVYLAGGTGSIGVNDGVYWNPFLNAMGLRFATSFNGIRGVVPITSADPIFQDVHSLYQNSGNSISVVDETNPNTAILEFFNGQGLYAVSTMIPDVPATSTLATSTLTTPTTGP